jgi:hypothetical protein
MFLCPIRYDWNDEEYTIFFSVLKSAHVHGLIGYALSFVRPTPTTIILLTSAFAPSIVVLMDLAATLRKGFYRAYCW